MIAYQSKKFHGFTLIELIITIVITGILFSVAIPSFSHILAQNQQTSLLYTIFAQLNFARYEAIKTNQQIMLCKSIDGKLCVTTTLWSDGWLIFADTDNNKKVSSNESILYIQQSLPDNIFFDYKGSGSSNYFRYFPNGRGSSNGTFTLCNHADEKMARSIIVSRSGRARIDNKKGSGEALTCS